MTWARSMYSLLFPDSYKLVKERIQREYNEKMFRARADELSGQTNIGHSNKNIETRVSK